MKNLDKLLSLDIITEKDLKNEGFSDYEIRKLVLEGVIKKIGSGIYKNKKDIFEKLVISFNNHDIDAVARIYDSMSDKYKYKYNGDIIKLLLVSLARIENILNNGYKLQNNDEKKVVELEKTDEDVINVEDNSYLEPLEENSVVGEGKNDLEIVEEVESDFDIDLFLDNLYCEYRNALKYRDYYRARDILLEYNYYCKEYNVDDDCFHELFTLTNKINSLELDIEESKSVSLLIGKIKKHIVNDKFINNTEAVRNLLDKFRTLPSSNYIYFYHRYKSDYLANVSSYYDAIIEYEKALKINPYNKHDYYKLALLYYNNMKSKNNCEKALKLMNKFSYYSRNIFTPNQLSLFANIYIFNFMGDRAIEVLESVEQLDEDYKSNFFKQFSLLYINKYNALKSMQYSNIEVKRDFAESFFESDYLDIFTKYALIYSGNFDNVFNEKKPYHQELEIAKSIINSDSMTKLNNLDEYLLKLDLSNEDKSNIMLDMAIYLTEQGFYDKASRYLKIIEKIKEKPDSVKENLIETRSKIKIRKIANKNRS